MPTTSTESNARQLTDWFDNQTGVVVAYSGGVDSAVVAQAAWLALGQQSLAATADSASLARHELQSAITLAAQIGITHRTVATQEVGDPAYQINDSQRCFHCKSHLFQTLHQLPEVKQAGWQIVTGTNQDDLGDWRPGLRAAEQFGARAPLAELGFGKATVRQLAEHWTLPVAEKPASPCLSSRLAYGLQVTPQRLAMIEAAESHLRSMGLSRFRVRLHPGDLARIEVPIDQLERFVDPTVRQTLVDALGRLGFKYVTLDLEGFSSGSLNKLIQVSSLTAPLP